MQICCAMNLIHMMSTQEKHNYSTRYSQNPSYTV